MSASSLTDAKLLLDECLDTRLPLPLREQIVAFLARRPGQPRKVDLTQIAKFRAAGLTVREIAAQLGVAASTVWRAEREAAK